VSASLPLGPVSEFSYAPVPPGTYTVTVQARNGAGTSAPSSPVTVIFPGVCTGAPQTPTNFVAFRSGGFVHLFWDPPAGGAAPTRYAVNVTGSFVGALAVTGRTFSAMAPPGTYHVSVSATSPCGTSVPTPAQTVMVP
jgi:hypothetical protein